MYWVHHKWWRIFAQTPPAPPALQGPESSPFAQFPNDGEDGDRIGCCTVKYSCDGQILILMLEGRSWRAWPWQSDTYMRRTESGGAQGRAVPSEHFVCLWYAPRSLPRPFEYIPRIKPQASIFSSCPTLLRAQKLCRGSAHWSINQIRVARLLIT